MKNILIDSLKVFVIVLFLFSCEEDSSYDSYDIRGKFSHTIEGCNNSLGFEINCVEFIEFLDNDNVNILMAGSDVVIQTKYKIKENIIEIDKSEKLPIAISFKIYDQNKIARKEDSKVWKREP